MSFSEMGRHQSQSVIIDRTIGKSDVGLLYAPHCAIALSLTIQPQYLPLNICDALFNREVGHFGSKFFRVFPLE